MIFVGFCVIGIVGLVIGRTTAKEAPVLPLGLKVSTEKDTYSLGEVVKLHFAVSNETGNPISLPFQPNVMFGYLNVWISFNDQGFQRYSNSSWGRYEGGGATLQPGAVFESEATVFGNVKPQIPRPNDGKIQTAYAFPKAGNYQIKAVLSIPEKDSPNTMRKLESRPIQITVTEPVGDDLVVWNRIKDKDDIALLIQRSDFPTYKAEKIQELIASVDEIVQGYPNSLLAGRLKAIIEKARGEEAKRKELLEKARVKPSN